MNIASVILAAGKGVRMNSTLPKVLHPILGQPIVSYAIAAAREVAQTQPVLVIGHEADEIRRTIGESVQYVVQEPQLGTGHAVLQTESLLRGRADLVLVTYADMPLLTADTLVCLIRTHQEQSGAMTMLTAVSEQPRGFGAPGAQHPHRARGGRGPGDARSTVAGRIKCGCLLFRRRVALGCLARD